MPTNPERRSGQPGTLLVPSSSLLSTSFSSLSKSCFPHFPSSASFQLRTTKILTSVSKLRSNSPCNFVAKLRKQKQKTVLDCTQLKPEKSWAATGREGVQMSTQLTKMAWCQSTGFLQLPPTYPDSGLGHLGELRSPPCNSPGKLVLLLSPINLWFSSYGHLSPLAARYVLPTERAYFQEVKSFHS